MNWKSIGKHEAQKTMEEWTSGAEYPDLSNQYEELRRDLAEAFMTAMQKAEIDPDNIKGKEYKADLYFGLEIYHLLNEKYQFTVRNASTEGIWRYLSIIVIPHIVEKRWGLNPGRFWKESRRIWLKAVWWYIHLSWQGSREATIDVLKGNTTDEIAQLVERSGLNGYRVDLYRQIMFFYGSIEADKKTRSSDLFRRIMKLNTAKTKVVEPELVKGGVQAYVKELFEYFEQREITRHH